MIKKTVTYINFDEVEITETVIFHFSIAGLKNFERFTGLNFFDEYSDAFKVFIDFFKEFNLKQIPTEDEISRNEELGLKMIGILTEPTINRFIVNYICSFYAQRHEGRFVQDEMTVEVAEGAMWLTEFLSLAFFLEVFNELSKNNFAQKKIPNLKVVN